MKERNLTTSKLESQAKGTEKIVMENERLRGEIRKVWEKGSQRGHMATLHRIWVHQIKGKMQISFK